MENMTVAQAHELLMAEGGTAAGDNDRLEREQEPDGPSSQEQEQEQDGLPNQEQEPDQEQERAYGDSSVGLGIDIVDIARMRGILERTPSFADHVFSSDECAYCRKMSNQAAHFAVRFAAKEAIVKALGTGFSDGIGVRDIEVVRMKGGRPVAKLSGRALEIAEEQGVRELSISLSYTHTDAVACAMAVTEASARASESRKDPMEELARQFKEARGMLDEL